MKTVMITGANRGLGLWLLNRFQKEGFNVIAHSREAMGDLRQTATIAALAKMASDGDVDILVNNAGVYLSRQFQEMNSCDIIHVIGTNLVAPIMLTRAVWPVFARKKSGMVVNINSMASKSGGPGESVYAASKAGLAGFSESLQFDATKDGVRVININLGAMKTDMTEARPDRDKFIDPKDAADIVVSICEDFPSARVTNIDIKRGIY